MIALPRTKPTLLVASLALALAATGQVHAVSLTAEANWKLDGGGVTTDSAAAPPGTSIGISGSPAGSPSSVFYSITGDDSGHYISRVSGDGQFDVTGRWLSSFDFTNTLGGPASFIYRLVIENGELTVDLPGTGGGTGLAEYTLILSLDNTEIARSEGKLTVNAANSVTLDKQGFDFGGTRNDTIATYYWSEFTRDFDLGTFGADESFTVDVELVTHASRDALNESCDGGYGPTLMAIGGNGYCGAIARFGDPPSTLADSGGGEVIGRLNQAPEPGTLALLGAGLAGLASLRRKRR